MGFVLECPEHFCSCSFKNKPVINKICAVYRKSKSVCYKKQIFHRFLVYRGIPEIEREYLQKNNQHIYIDRSRNVEQQSASHHCKEFSWIDILEHPMVEQVESNPAQ